MNRALFGFPALCSLFATACQPSLQGAEPPPRPKSVSSAALLGTWELVSLDGIAVPAKKVSITFQAGGAFSAVLDCNNARGFYSFTGAQLSFNGWYSTERGCIPPLQHEDLINAALIGKAYAVTFPVSSELHISGKHIVIFRRP